MPQKPFSFAKKDLRFVSTNRLIMIIGAKRYAIDIFIHYMELKPSPAEVIPINEHLRNARKPFDR
jgi:hypothetical protein